MNNPRLAGRYAKSLIDIAVEKGELETVYADMKLLLGACQLNNTILIICGVKLAWYCRMCFCLAELY